MCISSPKESYLIRQADIAATLATLTATLVPSGSVGVPIEQLLRASLDQYQLMLVYRGEALRLLEMLRGAQLVSGALTQFYADDK